MPFLKDVFPFAWRDKSPLEVLGDHIEQYVARNFTASTDGLDALRGVLQRYKADEDPPPPLLGLCGAPVSPRRVAPSRWHGHARQLHACRGFVVDDRGRARGYTPSWRLPELDLAWVEDGEEDELVSLIGST